MSQQNRKLPLHEKKLEKNKKKKLAEKSPSLESGERLNKSLDECLLISRASISPQSKSKIPIPRAKIKLKEATSSNCSDASFCSALSGPFLSDSGGQVPTPLSSQKRSKTIHASLDETATSSSLVPTDSPIKMISSQNSNDLPKDCDLLDSSTYATPSNVSTGYNTNSVEAENFVQTCDSHLLSDEAKSISRNILVDSANCELAGLLVSAETAQACVEVFDEDVAVKLVSHSTTERAESDKNEIQGIIKELVNQKEITDKKLDDLERLYSETYARMITDHTAETEIYKIETERNNCQLENEIKDLSAKSIVTETMMSGKDEIIDALRERVAELEKTLKEKEIHCRDELTDVLAKSMKSDILLKAKNDIEEELASGFADHFAKNDNIEASFETGDGQWKDTEKYLENSKIIGNRPHRQLKSFTPPCVQCSEVMNVKLEDKDMKISSLTAELANDERKLNELKNEKENAEQLAKTITENHIMEIRHLHMAKESLERQVDVLRAELSRLENDNSEMLLRNVAYEATMKELQYEKDQAVVKMEEMEKEALVYNEFQKLREAMEEEVNVLQKKNDEWHAKLQISQERIVELETEVRSLQDKLCTSSLEEELETSWTERCEVEEQLACVQTENDILRNRVNRLEAACRQLSGFIDSGLPSTASWIKMNGIFKSMFTDLNFCVEKMEVQEGEEDGVVGETLSHSLQLSEEPFGKLSDGAAESMHFVTERMEPEGGTLPLSLEPKITDDLDQSASVIQELLRYMGACEDVLNSSLGERLKLTPDISTFLENSSTDLREELDRYLIQLKDEAAYVFALSNDVPDTVTRLQEEIISLEQQLSASDKQLKSTRCFLEEQAAEREQERDEATRQLNELKKTIRSMERHLPIQEEMQTELDDLERGLQRAYAEKEECEMRRMETETKFEETVEKVSAMRDFIADLEMQLVQRSDELEACHLKITDLQDKLLYVGKLSLEQESEQKASNSNLLDYVAKLEQQLVSMQTRIEQSSPETLESVRIILRELDAAVSRRTRNLELVTLVANACSSASEEISTREFIDATRCQTPDEMADARNFGLEEDVERLRERLIKHTRAEEAAIKRMKELDMTARRSDELVVDLEVAQHRLEEYLTENATLKDRLEVYRSKLQQQQAAADLEKRVDCLEREIESKDVVISEKDKKIAESSTREKQLSEVINTLEAQIRQEAEAFDKVKEKLEKEEEHSLKALEKSKELENHQSIANVLLAQKNEQIDFLKSQLSECTDAEKRSIDSILTSTKGSGNSSKRVKFSIPESFVESITPIPVETSSILPLTPVNNSSVLRNASSGTNWLFDEPISRKIVLQDSDLPLAALQLSPRGSHIDKQQPSQPIEPSVIFSPQSPVPVEYEQKMPESLSEKHESELNSLREKVHQLEDELSEKASFVMTLEASSKVLKLSEVNNIRELDVMRASIKKATENEEQYRTEIQKMRTELLVHQNNYTELSQRYSAERNELNAELTITRDKLSKNLDELVTHKVNWLTQQKEFEDINKGHENEKRDLLRQLSDLRDELSVKYVDVAVQHVSDDLKHQELINVIKKSENDFNDLKAQLDVLQRDLSVARDEIASQCSSNDLKQRRIEDLELILKTKNDEFLSSRRSSQEQIDLLMERLIKDKEMFDMQKENLSAVLKKVDEFTSERETFEKTVEDIKLLRLQISQGIAEREALAREIREKEAQLITAEKQCEDFKLAKLESEKMIVFLREQLIEEQKRVVQMEEAFMKEDIATRVDPDGESGFDRKQGVMEATGEIIQLQSQVHLLEKLVQTLENRLQEDQNRRENDMELLVQLRLKLEERMSHAASVEAELAITRRRCDDLFAELDRVRGQAKRLRVNYDNAKMEEHNALRAQDELKHKLDAAQRHIRKLTYETDVQNVEVRGLANLITQDMNIRDLQNPGAIPRMVQSAEERSEDYMWRVHRLESYRKALVWQKRYLQAWVVPWRAERRKRRPRSLRIIAFVVVAVHRMRLIVRRWQSRLPPLQPSVQGKDKRLVLSSPPNKDPGLRLRAVI